ncbi:hypothetical protein GOODEAATRI_019077 [Goodea atripinnis]|uniref:Uncharacterized protein n=1 Tax=Goodea atripinnis TaxID=208336 RepID=A0ABV0NLF7_9TELE
MDLINGLHLCFQGSSIQSAAVDSTSVMTIAPLHPVTLAPPTSDALFGCAKGFVHKVKVSDTVPPVRQKLRSLPLSVRSTEIHHLLQAGVIEKIDASPWVSPISLYPQNCHSVCYPPESALESCSYRFPHGLPCHTSCYNWHLTF